MTSEAGEQLHLELESEGEYTEDMLEAGITFNIINILTFFQWQIIAVFLPGKILFGPYLRNIKTTRG
jgi:hypothetical protein